MNSGVLFGLNDADVVFFLLGHALNKPIDHFVFSSEPGPLRSFSPFTILSPLKRVNRGLVYFREIKKREAKNIYIYVTCLGKPIRYGLLFTHTHPSN